MIEVPKKRGTILLDDQDGWVLDDYWLAVGVRQKKNVEPLLVAEAIGKVKKDRWMLGRLLLKASPEQRVDFVNHDTLDLRRANIRAVSVEQDRANQRPFNINGYKGVIYIDTAAAPKKWYARFTAHKVRYSGARRNTPESAALDYNLMTIAYWGREQFLNEPPCMSPNSQPSPQRCSSCNAPCYCCCVCGDEPTSGIRRLYDTLRDSGRHPDRLLD